MGILSCDYFCESDNKKFVQFFPDGTKSQMSDAMAKTINDFIYRVALPKIQNGAKSHTIAFLHYRLSLFVLFKESPTFLNWFQITDIDNTTFKVGLRFRRMCEDQTTVFYSFIEPEHS